MKQVFIILFSLGFTYCKPITPQTKYVKEPVLEPASSYWEPHFDESFFNELHFAYSYGIQPDSNGKLVNTLQDGKADNTSVDTKEYQYSSETVISSKEKTSYLRIAEANLSNDTLTINLSDKPFSIDWYDCAIVKTSNQISLKYYQTTFILDSSYRPPECSTIEQHVMFDKKIYQKGDTVKAKFTAKIAALHTWGYLYRDTFILHGLVKTLVK